VVRYKHNINLVDSGYIRDELAAIYILQNQDEVAIIETGTTYSLPNVISALEQLDIEKSQVKYVIPTHIHLDHAGGAGAFLNHFDQSKLIVHPRGARHMINPDRLIQGVKQVYGEQKFNQYYGEILSIEEERVLTADDLQTYDLAGRELLFIDTPGHARHHFCIFDEVSNSIFSGDTFGLAYPQLDKGGIYHLLPTTTPVQFDPQALLDSIERLLAFKPDQMYLTHYGQLSQPAHYADSLKFWINKFVTLTKQIKPENAASDQNLATELHQIIAYKLKINSTETETVLGMDIQLNAQGLGHWWRTQQH